MNTVQLADEKVEPAIYQEDLVGYVFMFTLVGSVITAYLFWYFFARDTYPGTSASSSPSKDETQEPAAPESGSDSDRG